MDAARQVWATLREGGWKEVVRLVDSYAPETLHLEFKEKADSRHGNAEKKDRVHFSKCLSGFANSDGGVLVWGIKTRKAHAVDVASAVVLVAGVREFQLALTEYLPEAV